MHKGDDLAEVYWFMVTKVQLEDEDAWGSCFGLLSHIPWERVIGLETNVPILRLEELCLKMRGLILSPPH